MKLSNIDVIYIVRPGDDNEELRYSLRSVAKYMAHRRIVIAGHTPDWVKNVYSIETIQDGTKYQNAETNWRAAMADESVTDDFVIMNDDFYIMKPTLNSYDINLHRGSLDDVIGYYSKMPGPYIANMRRTRELLVKLGFEPRDLNSYALHIPMIMNKLKRRILQHVIDEAGYEPHQVQARTLYGNFWRVGGRPMQDVKTSGRDLGPKNNDTFLSSDDQSFNDGRMGEYIREQFKNKCKYER